MKKTLTANHLGYLDGLRALAAIFVVLHHAYLQVEFGPTPLPKLALKLLFGFELGRYAVDIFIVLSGFCLMLPIVRGDGHLRSGAKNFFVRRAWRILPPYYLAMAFSLALIWTLVGQTTGTHWDMSLPVTAKSIFSHLLLIHDMVGDNYTINHVFWSVAVEWRIYFLFPLLVLLWRRVGPVPTTIASVVGSLFLLKVCRVIVGDGLTAHYIGLFAMGMLGASLAFGEGGIAGRWSKAPWRTLTLALTLVVAIVSRAKVWHGELMPLYFIDLFVGLWTMALLVMIARDQTLWISKLLNYRPLVFTGTFAYSIYLIHGPLLQVFWQYIFIPLQDKPLLMFAALALVATPIIVGISYGFFWACERPFLGKGKKTDSNSLVVQTALQPAP